MSTNISSRVKLGEVIAFHYKERGFSHHEVCRRLKIKSDRLNDIERGAIVPTSDEWKALTRGINRSLRTFDDLYQRAKHEAAAERGRVVTSLGSKLSAVIDKAPASVRSLVMTDDPAKPMVVKRDDGAYTAGPPPDGRSVAEHLDELTKPHDVATCRCQQCVRERSDWTNRDGDATHNIEKRKEPTVKQAKPPSGYKSAERVAERREWAKGVLRMRPNIRIHGADSLDELMKARYGVGISHETASELRAELRAEQAGPTTPTTPAPTPPSSSQPELEGPPPQASGRDDVETAVDLIVAAIPNLRSFKVERDDSGAISVSVKLREVVVRESEIAYTRGAS